MIAKEVASCGDFAKRGYDPPSCSARSNRHCRCKNEAVGVCPTCKSGFCWKCGKIKGKAT